MEDTITKVKNGSRDGYAIPYYEIPYEKFFQFRLSVDCVVFGYHESSLKGLTITRGAAPFKGSTALPGDLVYPNENLDAAAERILNDLTGISNLFLKQTGTYGEVSRHPAGRVITVGYYALIDIAKHDPHASAWADGVEWTAIEDIPKLAFDHNLILNDSLCYLREQVRKEPIAFRLLPEKFTLGELQDLFEAVLGSQYDKANFRKKMLSLKLLKDTNELQKDVPHRPGKLFTFNHESKNTSKYAFDL